MIAYLFKFTDLRRMAAAALFLSLVFPATTALAHRVVIFAWMEGDTVFTESQFPDGRKIADAPVKVFDMNDTLLLEGKTNDVGEFSFKVPKTEPLHIVLEAGMGHQGEWTISEEEILRAMGPAMNPSVDATLAEPEPAPQMATGPADTSQQPTDPALFMDEKKLEKMIETALDKTLDKKLQPIVRTLAKMQQPGPSVHDIIGGIGYIFGLMGVAAYFLSRKRND